MNPKVSLRRFILFLAAFACITSSAVAAPTPVERWEKTLDGVVLHLKPGTLLLQVCAEGIVRVSYSPTDAIGSRTDFLVVKRWAPAPFELTEKPDALSLATERLTVRVDRATGSLSFFDKSGRPILQEAPEGGKRMTPVVVNGESAYTTEQAFVSPADECLYGMAEAQDGIWNWRGLPIELRQLNTQTALPALVSSKGYGLLWNNASLTDFNPVDTEVPLELAQTNGDVSGPTATEQLDASAKKKDASLTVRTGAFTADAAGEYVFFAKEGDRKKQFTIEVDGQRIAGLENLWVPYTATVKTHLSAGQSVKIKVVGGGPKARLFARPLGERTVFRSQVGDAIDYYFFFGPKMDEVIAGIREATGDAPMWPKWAFGFWQCRERYSSQQQILNTVAEFRKRQIPLDLLVQDWQYWGAHGWGAYQWNEKQYSDPKDMIEALHAQNTKFMISVWSNPSGPVHDELAAGKMLIKDQWVDAYNPKARDIRWRYLNDAFLGIGTDAWWQDATEPGDDGTAVDGSTTAMGSGNRVRNAYPLFANQTVYEGQRATNPDKRVVILTRASFPGQQRYGAALWTGDIAGSWDGFRRQLSAGLNASLTGLPYWTTDCGGFFRPKDQYISEDYNELLVRWFQYSAFCPILRIHGYQSETEMWKFDKAYEHLLRYDRLRYRMLPYNYALGWQVTHGRSTIMRALLMDFPDDARACRISDQYMHGPALLVCPVTAPRAVSRKVYLPGNGQWHDFWTGKTTPGGQEIDAAAPLDTIPLFVRAGSILPLGPNLQYATEKPADPIELRVYAGVDGSFSLYDDESDNYNYERGQFATIPIEWNDATHTLTIGKRAGSYPGMAQKRTFQIVLVREGHGVGDAEDKRPDETVDYTGEAVSVSLKK